MTADFTAFYENPNYRQYKRHLFNYLLRKNKVRSFLNVHQKPILDVGSGIAPMAPDDMRAFLGDSSFTAMKVMRHDGHRSVVLDISNLGVMTNGITTVICSEVLEHIDEDWRAIQELHRVLRPGGYLILTVPLHQRYWGRDDEIAGHRRRYDLAALVQRLQSCGFEVITVTKVGSLFERFLTLATTTAFVKTEKSIPTFGGFFMSVFALTNQLIARLLDVASTLSPQTLNSIGLLYCQKH
jgi:SAM-dependent methyltransferase